MTLPVTQGDVLAGKYRVEHILGTGGMGVVVCARHMQLDALVALKFMLPQAAEDKEAVSRFLREARAAARLRGEHIARVTDVGMLESGAPYLVMEYLEGKDLAATLSEGRPSVPQAVEYVVQTCEALEEAHSRGIIHRDIKPSNLFLTKKPNGQPSIKVLDFGISKLAPSSSTAAPAGAAMSATSTKAVFGSPLYMAPEQMRSAAKVDARADVWSLGATLYELLAGRVPFLADSIMDLCLKVAQEPPDRLRELRPEVPAELEAIVERCLAKDPSERFASVADLAVALTPYAVKRRPSMVDDDPAAETHPVPGLTGPAPAFAIAPVPVAPVEAHDAQPANGPPAASTQKSSDVAAPAASAAVALPAQVMPVQTGANWGNTSGGPSKAPTGWGRSLWLGGGGVVVAVALVALVATRGSLRPSTSAATVPEPSVPSVGASPTIPELPPSAATLAPLAPSTDPAPSLNVSAPAPSPTPAPVASAPAAVSRPRVAPDARPTAAPGLSHEPTTRRTHTKPTVDPYANPN